MLLRRGFAQHTAVGWGHDIAEICSDMSERCHYYFQTIDTFSRFLFGHS